MPKSPATRRPTYGNWRLPARPGIGALGLTGTVVLLGGLILALVTALLSWVAAAGVVLAVAMVTVPLAVRTVDGRSGFSVLASRAGWILRRMTGQSVYVSGPLSRVPGGRFRLPGLLAGLRMLETADCYGRSFGVVHDPGVNSYTVVLECDPDGGALVDAAQVDRWVSGWGGLLSELSTEPGLLGAAVVVETAPDPGTGLAAEVLPRLDPSAPAAARKIMTDLVRSYPAASSDTSTYVTLTYRPVAAGRRLAGRAERDAAMLSTLAVRVPPLAAALAVAGAGAAVPLPPDRIADAMRVAFDPSAAATVLAARAESGSSGQKWESAGPVAAVEGPDSYCHEDAVSRTWVASEAPRGTVRSSVLKGLLEPSPRIARKRVTLLYRPLDQASAARVVEADRRTAHFMASSSVGLVRARAAGTVRAAEQTAAEEASGASLVEFGMIVTATVASRDELDAADAEIANLAAAARLRLRVARGQQASAFAAALPAGLLPWLHTFVPYQLRSAL